MENRIKCRTERKRTVVWKEETPKVLGCVLGGVIYSAGINIFTAPCNLYTGGIMGVCQIIRTVLAQYLHITLSNMDIAGVIYYIINIPILIVACRKLGKKFFLKTLICVTAVTAAMSLIPVPSVSILQEDVLAASVIGGIVSGIGVGITLRMSGSAGGMDIIGVLLIQWKKNFSVGQVNLMLNVLVYIACLFLFDIRIVIYSLIYAAVMSIATDKVHAQNINVEVTVITKNKDSEMEKRIFRELGRGITKWQSLGAYTQEQSEVLYIMLSKYEVNRLRQIVHEYDSQAFIVVNEGVHVDGNYLKKL